MKRLVSSLLRWLLWPAVYFTQWAGQQYQTVRNDRLRRRLNAAAPDTLSLAGAVHITCPENCTVGRGVAIHDAEWNARGGITIGNYVHFGARVTILTASHNYEGDEVPYDATFVVKPVIIEDNVWIGCDVVIAPGTHLEEGAVIAMGAVISGHVPKGAIVGSQKWRILKHRDMDKYEAIKAAGKFH